MNFNRIIKLFLIKAKILINNMNNLNKYIIINIYNLKIYPKLSLFIIIQLVKVIVILNSLSNNK